MQGNFGKSLQFVWQPGYDSPLDGDHATPGDAGGETKGGVILSVWNAAVARGLVSGSLADAASAQLAVVLRDEFWGAACDALPAGLDFALFNGRMMSGGYPRLFQQCVGLVDDDVAGDDEDDGVIGQKTLKAVVALAPHVPTLVTSLYGVHFAYCRALPGWPEFKGGWTKRLKAAKAFALAMA